MKTRKEIPAFLLCLFLSLLCSPAHAQVSEKEKKEKELEKRQLLEKKTYALLEETANGAPSLKLPENRSYILVTAADLLWDHDKDRARGLFRDALNALMLLTLSPKSEPNSKPTAKDKEHAQSQYLLVFSLRQNLLRRVARRDALLALDMLRSSRQPSFEATNDRFALPDDSELEQQIAAEAVANDPQRALQLARESLAKGLSFQLFELLYQLNQKDAELGTKFAGDIIDKLRTTSLATDLYGGRIAVSLLNFSRAPLFTAGKKSSPGAAGGSSSWPRNSAANLSS